MVITGIKSSEFPIKHLAKTFLFNIIHFKAKSKDLAVFGKCTTLLAKYQNPY